MASTSQFDKLPRKYPAIVVFVFCAVCQSLMAQTNKSEAPVLPPAASSTFDFHLKSKDRMFEGYLKVPDTWKNVSWRFVNVSSHQVLGTYPDVLESMHSPKPGFKIYEHQDDMFSDQDMADAKKDPNVTEQKVTFYKDDKDPGILHFASIFDDVGTIQVQVLKDGKQIACGETKLTADAEFSSLIQTVDKAISEPPGGTNQGKTATPPAPGK